MNTAVLLQQQPGIGTLRSLRPDQEQHVVCLLRMIEQLPLMSEIPNSELVYCPETFEKLCRCLKGIHQNHIELSQCVAQVLSVPSSGEYCLPPHKE